MACQLWAEKENEMCIDDRTNSEIEADDSDFDDTDSYKFPFFRPEDKAGDQFDLLINSWNVTINGKRKVCYEAMNDHCYQVHVRVPGVIVKSVVAFKTLENVQLLGWRYKNGQKEIFKVVIFRPVVFFPGEQKVECDEERFRVICRLKDSNDS